MELRNFLGWLDLVTDLLRFGSLYWLEKFVVTEMRHVGPRVGLSSKLLCFSSPLLLLYL